MKRSASKVSNASRGSKPQLRFVDAAGEHTFGGNSRSQSPQSKQQSPHGTGDESALRHKIAQRSSPQRQRSLISGQPAQHDTFKALNVKHGNILIDNQRSPGLQKVTQDLTNPYSDLDAADKKYMERDDGGDDDEALHFKETNDMEKFGKESDEEQQQSQSDAVDLPAVSEEDDQTEMRHITQQKEDEQALLQAMEQAKKPKVAEMQIQTDQVGAQESDYEYKAQSSQQSSRSRRQQDESESYSYELGSNTLEREMKNNARSKQPDEREPSSDYEYVAADSGEEFAQRSQLSTVEIHDDSYDIDYKDTRVDHGMQVNLEQNQRLSKQQTMKNAGTGSGKVKPGQKQRAVEMAVGGDSPLERRDYQAQATLGGEKSLAQMEQERREKYQMQKQLQVKKQQLKEQVEKEKQLQREREKQKDYERKQRALQTKDKLKAYQQQLKHAQDLQIKQNEAIAAQFEQIKLEQERADVANASDYSDDAFEQASPKKKANTKSVTSLFEMGSLRSPVRKTQAYGQHEDATDAAIEQQRGRGQESPPTHGQYDQAPGSPYQQEDSSHLQAGETKKKD